MLVLAPRIRVVRSGIAVICLVSLHRRVKRGFAPFPGAFLLENLKQLGGFRGRKEILLVMDRCSRNGDCFHGADFYCIGRSDSFCSSRVGIAPEHVAHLSTVATGVLAPIRSV